MKINLLLSKYCIYYHNQLIQFYFNIVIIIIIFTSLRITIKHKQLTRRRYYKECSQYGCTRVSAVDKNDLLEYLKGKREASAVVQLKADDELGTESVNEPPAKRQKLEDGSALTTKTSESELSHEPMELTASDWAAREEFSKRLDSKTREGDASTKATLVNLAAETGLSLEKIEALKMKAKLKKKTPGDENTADKVLEDELRETPATANSYLTRSVAVVKDITSRERPMRTRASVLQLKGKEFKYILDTLHTLTKQQKTARPDAKKTIDFAKKPATQPTQPATRYDRYNFNEDASFWKEKLKGDGKGISSCAVIGADSRDWLICRGGRIPD